MKTMRGRAWLQAALACALGCSTAELQPDSLLEHGDAEWTRPPFDPPGGNGDAPADSGGYDDGGAASTASGGTSGFDPSGSSGGEESSSSSSSSDGGETATDTDTDTEGCDGSTGDACGQAVPEGKPELANPPAVIGDDPPLSCPDAREPVVLYMSNDDSNSQASPILARRAVAEGVIVDPFRIRIHEFLNYYDLSYENPEDAAARVGMQMRRIDKETGQFVLLLYAQGQRVDPETRPPMNLVFSLDTSGSMSGEPIELLRQTMRAVASSLRKGDVVSMVEWSSDQVIPLEGYTVSGPNDPGLLDVIDTLDSDGSTDLHGGLVTAYQLANQYYARDRLNRVVLISDGGANTGITDIDLIAAEANDSDGEGIYLVGVGVGSASGYRDDLMDDVTDAGKGAYVFVDSAAEAHRMFGERFVQNMMVAARNVQMELTLPWYFGIKAFHGEEYSEDPAEVEPQHLSPNDAMSYHQIIQSCDPGQIFTKDRVKAKATFEDPITREPKSSEMELAIGDIVRQNADQLYKGDVVVAYAQAFIVIGDLVKAGSQAQAKQVASDMVEWLDTAATRLSDAEVAEMRDVMKAYADQL